MVNFCLLYFKNRNKIFRVTFMKKRKFLQALKCFNSKILLAIIRYSSLFSLPIEKRPHKSNFFSSKLLCRTKVYYYIPYHYIYSILQIYQWECSAEAVTPELVRQFFKIFPTGKTICNFYGSTEMSDVTYATFCSLEDFESKLDSNRQADSTPFVFMYYIFPNSMEKQV